MAALSTGVSLPMMKSISDSYAAKPLTSFPYISLCSRFTANKEQRERERERERDENTRGEATGSDFPTSDSAKQVGRKKSRPTEETDRTKRVGAGRRVNEQKGLDKSNGRMHRLDRDNEGPREA